jgi:regulation of enolase protein 1 (concanavalin A-like superfamily)
LVLGRIAPGKTVRVPVTFTAPTPTRPLPEETVRAAAIYVAPASRGSATFSQTVHRPTPVQSPWQTYAAVDKSTPATFGQLGDAYAIIAAGSDVSGTNNQYGAIYRPDALTGTGTANVRVAAQQPINSSMKSGLMVRSGITQAATGTGYVTLETSPNDKVQLQWDADGNGQLDHSASATVAAATPVWLRIVRSGPTFTGEYSTDGSTWTTVGSATVASATGAEDVGMFTSSHNKYSVARADFDSFGLTG